MNEIKIKFASLDAKNEFMRFLDHALDGWSNWAADKGMDEDERKVEIINPWKL